MLQLRWRDATFAPLRSSVRRVVIRVAVAAHRLVWNCQQWDRCYDDTYWEVFWYSFFYVSPRYSVSCSTRKCVYHFVALIAFIFRWKTVFYYLYNAMLNATISLHISHKVRFWLAMLFIWWSLVSLWSSIANVRRVERRDDLGGKR